MDDNRIQRSPPGTEFTTMTSTGEPMGGLLPVRATTVEQNGAEEWVGTLVLPVEKEDKR